MTINEFPQFISFIITGTNVYISKLMYTSKFFFHLLSFILLQFKLYFSIKMQLLDKVLTLSVEIYSELKTLEWDILNPDWIINLEIKNERRISNI